MAIMAMDRQTGQEMDLRHPLVHRQEHPLALQQGHPIVLRQEHPIVLQPAHPIAPQPGHLRRHVHQQQTFLRLQGDQVEPGAPVVVVVE
jgi:hypothetical protein